MLSSIKLFLSTYETYAKIGIILIYTAFIWYCHGIYDKARLEEQKNYQLIQAQKGETKIMETHQKIRKAYAKSKDACLNTNVPANIIKLLK